MIEFSNHDRKNILPSMKISDAPDTRSEEEAATRIHREPMSQRKQEGMPQPEIKMFYDAHPWDVRYWMVDKIGFCTFDGRFVGCRAVPSIQDESLYFIEVYTDRMGWTMLEELRPGDRLWAYYTPQEREAARKFKPTMYAPVAPLREQVATVVCGIVIVCLLTEIALRLL